MVRVRFAPSPTGYLHVGSLRTCLYNWLLAKKEGGKFVLRIEDTDRQRYVEGAVEGLEQTLKQVGLDWDKGPYFQSERQAKGIYNKYVRQLLDQGHAYYCFCSKERLDEMRQEQQQKKQPPHYDGHCRRLSEEEIKQKLEQKIPYVVRLKVPRSPQDFTTLIQKSEHLTKKGVVFSDIVRGKIEIDYAAIDDQVLLKSDGWPTYHLAVVVDDHLMKISHVIRGEEWLSSTPKHVLLYSFLDWPLPQFIHLPLLLNPDKSKLSKRQGDVSVEDYLAKGYLPQALLNFVALLGWNPGTDQEIFSPEELIKAFSLERIQKSGAIFDREKLLWMNGIYIRQLSGKRLAELCLPYLKKADLVKDQGDMDRIEKIVSLAQERLKKLEDIVELTEFFFVDQLSYDPQLLQWKKMRPQGIKESLHKSKQILSEIPEKDFLKNKIVGSLKKIGEQLGTGEVFWPLRVSLTGRRASPPPEEVAEVLGKDRVMARIDQALTKLKP